MSLFSLYSKPLSFVLKLICVIYIFISLQHSIVSNFQTLLHRESEVSDPHYLLPHLSKKLETVLLCLPTVPMLRGVALEILSSCFKYLAGVKGRDVLTTPLSSLVHSTCEVLYSLLLHSPSGWSHTLFQWGVVNLARLSVLYDVDSLPKEGVVNYMMSQECEFCVYLFCFFYFPLSLSLSLSLSSAVPFIVKLVEEGVRYKWVWPIIIIIIIIIILLQIF